MVSKNIYQQQNGRPIQMQLRSGNIRAAPYKKPYKQLPMGNQIMFTASQIPGDPAYMDFSNPTPPINKPATQIVSGSGAKQSQPQPQQKKNKTAKGKQKGKQQQQNVQQLQHQQQQQQQSMQHANANNVHNHNGNWHNNKRNYQDKRFNGGMQRNCGGGGVGGPFNQAQMMAGGGPLNRHMLPRLGGPRIGPVPPHAGRFQPPMAPPMRGLPVPPMGGGIHAPPSLPPPMFLRRSGRGGPMRALPPMLPPPPPQMMAQRLPPRGPPPMGGGPFIAPAINNNGHNNQHNNNNHNHNNSGKIKKPNPKLIKQTLKGGKSTIKTLKNLINQYPIDKPWVTDIIREAHDTKLDIENRLKGHKNDELFAQFKIQRDKFVGMYETAREAYLKQEAAKVMAKDVKEKQTLNVNKKITAAVKLGIKKDALPKNDKQTQNATTITNNVNNSAKIDKVNTEQKTNTPPQAIEPISN